MTTRAIEVSVVIPAKNRAKTLPYCLDSVLEQTLPPAEVIVVDDSSNDNTADVVRTYSSRGVVYRRLSAGYGAQAARNEGVRVARHPWVAFQDSDDLWLPDKLALQWAALQETGKAGDVVIHGNALQRREGSDTLLTVPETSGHCHALLLKRPAPMFPAMLVPRRALEDCGYLDEACPSYQEWDTALRLSRSCRFVHLAQPLFVWIWHSSETISKDVTRDLAGYNYILDTYKTEIARVHGERFWRQQKLSKAVTAMRAGLWDVALAHLERCDTHRSVAIARMLARAKFVPPGAGRLLRLAAC